MMSAYSRALADWEQSGYGAMLSVPQHTLGIFAAMLQWEVRRARYAAAGTQCQQDAARYKSLLLQFPYASHALVFCRDQDWGRVTIDGEGRPVLHYWPSTRDQANIIEVRL